MSAPQLLGIEAALEDRILGQNLRNIVGSMQAFLMTYASLTPEQRLMVESKSGLPSSRLTDGQKRRLVEAVYGIYPDDDFDAESVRPFTFSVEQFESDMQKVDRLLQDRGSMKRIWTGGAGPGAAQDFVIFRLTGGLDEIGVFNWPEDLKR